MVNIWKVSTLALAGLLAVVVGQGSVRETQACDAEEPSAEEVTQIRLTAALSFLDKAEMQLRAAPAAKPKPLNAALEQITLAKFNVKRGLERDQPKPPMKRAGESAKVVSVLAL